MFHVDTTLGCIQFELGICKSPVNVSRKLCWNMDVLVIMRMSLLPAHCPAVAPTLFWARLNRKQQAKLISTYFKTFKSKYCNIQHPFDWRTSLLSFNIIIITREAALVDISRLISYGRSRRDIVELRQQRKTKGLLLHGKKIF